MLVDEELGPWRIHPRLLAAAAAAVALVHCTLWWLYYRPIPKALWGDETAYWRSARALLAGDPGWWPDPLWPPLYPRLLAGIMAIGGPTVLWVQIVQTCLLAAAALLLYDLVRRLSGSPLAAAVAAILTLGFPPLAAYAHYLWPEIPHLFLFLAVLWLLAVRADRPLWCGVAGVAAGLALLTKSLLGPFLPVLMVAAFARRPASRSIGRALVFVAALVLTVAPAVLEQHRRTGRLMIADSSAFNLWVGLNDRSRTDFEIDVVTGLYREYTASAESFVERDRILREKIRGYLDTHSWTGIVRSHLGRQYFRLFDRDCYLTNQLPGGAAVERYSAGYLRANPTVSKAVRATSYLLYGLLLVLAPLGLALWRFRDRRWLTVLLLFVLYNLAIFFWLHVKSRYRIQLLPVAFLGAGCAVAWLDARLEGKPVAAGGARWRWLAAIVAAGLLEVLAFGCFVLP
jgi:4-amino-4-deoxy-L-arabinose transferase-like glycosyltransferase